MVGVTISAATRVGKSGSAHLEAFDVVVGSSGPYNKEANGDGVMIGGWNLAGVEREGVTARRQHHLKQEENIRRGGIIDSSIVSCVRQD